MNVRDSFVSNYSGDQNRHILNYEYMRYIDRKAIMMNDSTLTNEKRVNGMKCDDLPATTKIIVMLKRLLAVELRHHNLSANTKQQRMDIIDWIEEQGLSGQLARIDEPSDCNLLLAEGTLALAASLQFAPGVLCVALVGDFEMKVLDE